MSDSIFASGSTQLSAGAPLKPYSKVILWYDDDHAFVSGDDTGQTLEADCPWATQEMADKMLSRVQGFVYSPFNGRRANIDPAAELGDGVTLDGTYGMLASMECIYDAMSAVDVSAPSGDELEDEGAYKDKTQRSLSRKVTLGANYYGTRITRQNGLEIVKTAVDGTEKSRVVLNSDILAFYNDDGEEALYFDAEAGKYKFRGMLDVSGNFIVKENGDVTINGNIDLSGGTITWGGNKPESGISASAARTLISQELVSSPTIAGGKFMDLQQQAYLQMGSDAGAGTLYGYLNMFVPAYDQNQPMFSAYCRYNQTSGAKAVALTATGTDFLVVDGSGTVFPTGDWDFIGASVYNFSADRIDTGRVIVGEIDEYDLRIYSKDGSIRIAAPNGYIKFFVDGATWWLDAKGLHT